MHRGADERLEQNRSVEKPPPGTEPSRLVALRRYLYHPEDFADLRDSRASFSGKGEFAQTEAINQLAVRRFEGKLLDAGTPMGDLQAIVEYGLARGEFREELLEFLREIVEREGE